MSVAERQIVSAIVEARAEAKDGWKLELDVPEFRSKYPTKVSHVKEAVAKLLPPRAAPYSVVLVRENLMKDKSGDLPWHYYWGLEGLASEQETAAATVRGEPESRDERGLQIAWAQSINCAIATLGQAGPDDNKDDYLIVIHSWAEQYYPMIRNRPTDAPAATERAPETKTPTGTRKAPPKASSGTPMLSVEELVEWANKNGYSAIGPDGTWDKDGTKRQMAKVKGVTEAIVSGKLNIALDLLTAEAKKGPVV